MLGALTVRIPIAEQGGLFYSDTTSLPRQVILHACFAHHRSTSPRDFTDSVRCPAWLRLATDRGMFVSVAQAVSTAVSEKLLQSQPPHRSERPPSFDTSFRKTIDRSFFYLPYPPPGQWYLSLYAECYSTMNISCSLHPASTVDVAFVIRSSPCLNHRCRASGEGASLPPSGALDPSITQLRATVHNSYRTKRWRPSWWNTLSPNGTSDDAPRAGKYDTMDEEETGHPYDGLCIELSAHSLNTSNCVCSPGRFGIGCTLPKLIGAPKHFRSTTTELIVPEIAWQGYSEAALWLSMSNLAFLPSILLALMRGLWIPAVAYTYTLVFSTVSLSLRLL
ncbi:unnamed protein product [Dicrocoelium dendriticum]|nr:unnamed protein product [Dicrocoelium dendriticum]